MSFLTKMFFGGSRKSQTGRERRQERRRIRSMNNNGSGLLHFLASLCFGCTIQTERDYAFTGPPEAEERTRIGTAQQDQQEVGVGRSVNTPVCNSNIVVNIREVERQNRPPTSQPASRPNTPNVHRINVQPVKYLLPPPHTTASFMPSAVPRRTLITRQVERRLPKRADSPRPPPQMSLSKRSILDEGYLSATSSFSSSSSFSSNSSYNGTLRRFQHERPPTFMLQNQKQQLREPSLTSVPFSNNMQPRNAPPLPSVPYSSNMVIHAGPKGLLKLAASRREQNYAGNNRTTSTHNNRTTNDGKIHKKSSDEDDFKPIFF